MLEARWEVLEARWEPQLKKLRERQSFSLPIQHQQAVRADSDGCASKKATIFGFSQLDSNLISPLYLTITEVRHRHHHMSAKGHHRHDNMCTSRQHHQEYEYR